MSADTKTDRDRLQNKMSRGGTVVGALACQRDSYLRTLTTTVLRCTPIEAKTEEPKKGKKGKKAAVAPSVAEPAKLLYEVELEDTVLFPEGGGQPADTGTIRAVAATADEVRVLDVQRRELRAVHVVDGLLAERAAVEVTVDWRRRLDHMQQHTGQHLLSAVLDKMELPTLSWSMGAPASYVEVPRRLSEAEVAAVGQAVNDEILRNTAVSVETPGGEPDGEKGALRVVSIGQLDSNPCCGTHLSSVGQVKAVALLGQTKGKGGASRLGFVAGDRVYQYAGELHEVVRRVAGTLSNSVEELDGRAGALVKQCKRLQQREKALRRELAALKAHELWVEASGQHGHRGRSGPRVLSFFRDDADGEFLNSMHTALKQEAEEAAAAGAAPLPEPLIVALIAGADGAVLVAGLPGAGEGTATADAQAAVTAATAEVVATLQKELPGLRGGGGGKTARFQGKLVGLGEEEVRTAAQRVAALKL